MSRTLNKKGATLIAAPDPIPIIGGNGATDAFGRIRTSTPTTLFDAQLTYDLQPLLYNQVTNGSGAAIAHDSTNRCALMTFASTPTGGLAYMQTFQSMRYQAGKGQVAFVTFNMIEGVADVLKFAGYADGSNGIQFELDGTSKQFTLYSDADGGDETVVQANWSLDPLDGTGPSGITLDITKTQILVVDFQALYVGRVRVGFDIGGDVIYVHEFNHANLVANPYIQTANLPVRCGMSCTGTVSTTMKFICCSVQSDGGIDDTVGYTFAAEGTATAASGADTHILSIQPKATFNSIANRSRIQLDSINILVTGNSPVLWKLCIGQAMTGETLTDVNATYSGVQTVTGTLSGVPAIVVESGYIAASATAKGFTASPIKMRYPITLDYAGAARILGRLTLLVQGVGGNSACRAIFNWREIR